MKRCLNKLLAVALLGGLAPLAVLAQDAWPSKPLRLLVAFPPGSPGDTIARLISPSLRQTFNQPIVVDNKPGASGNIGMQEVIRSADEHTVLFGVDTMVTINPHIYKKLPYKPLEDLVPVTLLAAFSQMLVCHPSVPAKSLPQLLALAHKQDLNYASGGQGVPGHMAMEMVLASTQTRMTHVPYRGPAPAMLDVLAGNVPCGFLASPVVGPFVKDGKLTGIAVSGAKRVASQPGIPTVEESGIKEYDATFFEIVAMPKRTPPARVLRLQQAIAVALQSPEVRSALSTLDLEPVGNTPAAAARRLKEENMKWGAVAARVSLRVD
ncbi:Tripartite tricarboxylate transporter family receptor [compost metagenome]